MGTVLVFTGMGTRMLEAAAKEFARDLGMSIFRIDLDRVISKYIGETEKNLERVLRSAVLSQTIHLFDEADALFGKRTNVKDAHDKYANLEKSFLLDLLERYKGIVIMLAHPSGEVLKRKSKTRRVLVRFPPRYCNSS